MKLDTINDVLADANIMNLHRLPKISSTILIKGRTYMNSTLDDYGQNFIYSNYDGSLESTPDKVGQFDYFDPNVVNSTNFKFNDNGEVYKDVLNPMSTFTNITGIRLAESSVDIKSDSNLSLTITPVPNIEDIKSNLNIHLSKIQLQDGSEVVYSQENTPELFNKISSYYSYNKINNYLFNINVNYDQLLSYNIKKLIFKIDDYNELGTGYRRCSNLDISTSKGGSLEYTEYSVNIVNKYDRFTLSNSPLALQYSGTKKIVVLYYCIGLHGTIESIPSQTVTNINQVDNRYKSNILYSDVNNKFIVPNLVANTTSGILIENTSYPYVFKVTLTIDDLNNPAIVDNLPMITVLTVIPNSSAISVSSDSTMITRIN